MQFQHEIAFASLEDCATFVQDCWLHLEYQSTERLGVEYLGEPKTVDGYMAVYSSPSPLTEQETQEALQSKAFECVFNEASGFEDDVSPEQEKKLVAMRRRVLFGQHIELSKFY